MMDLLYSVCHWTRINLWTIDVAWAATILSIFSSDMNRTVKRLVKRLHFPLRLAVYVAVCAFGNGALTLLLGSAATRMVSRLSDPGLCAAILLLFIAAGLLAERKNQI